MLNLTFIIILITIFTFIIGLKISLDTGIIAENTYKTLEQINTNVYQTKPILKEAHECILISSEELNNLGITTNLSKDSYLGETFFLNVKGAPEKNIFMQVQIPNNIETVYTNGYPNVKIKKDTETYPGSYAIVGYWKQEFEPGDKVKFLILYDLKNNAQLITGGRTFTYSSARIEETRSTFDCTKGFQNKTLDIN